MAFSLSIANAQGVAGAFVKSENGQTSLSVPTSAQGWLSLINPNPPAATPVATQPYQPPAPTPVPTSLAATPFSLADIGKWINTHKPAAAIIAGLAIFVAWKVTR